MDTPQRPQQPPGTSISTVEHSPVFDYINNLSPIQLHQSGFAARTLHSLSFSSPPSVFTSPHPVPNKDKKIQTRYLALDSVPDYSSHDFSMKSKSCSNGLPVETLNAPPETLDYNCGSPEHNTVPCFASNVDFDKSQIREESGSEWANSLIDCTENQTPFHPPTESKVNGQEISYLPEISQNGNSWERSQCPVPCDVDQNNPPPACRDSQDEEVSLSNVDHEQRGIRRRCLVFEVGNSKNNSFKEISDEKNQNTLKPISGPNLQVLPSIGLHLNSLAKSSKVRIESEENPSTGRKLLSLPCPNSAIIRNDASVSQSHEFDLESPGKKKCETESGTELGTCRRCNCKKSKCLKLYCECFAAGVYCVGPCACEGCLNKPIHEDIVLATRKQIMSRNPLAFAPKVISASVLPSLVGEDSNKTPASARHKRGCNCKKSGCLKKYCECYQGGVGCSVGCRCEGCKNTFGVREATATEKQQLKEEQVDLGVDHDVDFTPSFQNNRPSIGPSPLLAACQKNKKSMPDEEMPRILRETQSPMVGVKVSSPNRKRVSPPHYEMDPSPSRKGGRRLVLRSIPSFPALSSFPEMECLDKSFA